MDAPIYIDILQQTLLPFVEEVYPDSRHLMQNKRFKAHVQSWVSDFSGITAKLGGIHHQGHRT